MKKDTGFTLIELVIVIATVAVLALLPLTALAKTKSESRRINCVGNLKRVGMSFRLWAANHGDRYPMRVSSLEGGPALGTTLQANAAGNQANMYQVFGCMSNELSTPKILYCPAESYIGTASPNNKVSTPASNFSTASYLNPGQYGNRATSYFIGVDADGSRQQMFLAGDHNMGAGSPANNNPPVSISAVYMTMTALSGNNLQARPAAAWTEGVHQAEGNVCLVDGSVQQLTIAKLRDALMKTADPGYSGLYNRVVFPR